MQLIKEAKRLQQLAGINEDATNTPSTPGTSTAPNNTINIESSYGTNLAPTTMLSNQNLGGISVGGYDGANWPADYGQSYNFLGWYSSEAMTSSGTSTYQAGSGFNIYLQIGRAHV